MFYNVIKAKDFTDNKEQKFERKILLENNNSSFSIISIKKDEIIDTHTSPADVAVYVLDGKIEIHFEAEKFELEKGEIIMFKKEKEHKVLALKDSTFFLIKI
ncbi:MAG: cupin domain-containing protein [bacterium]|nr:cupin domain-containing protein [bacterium]